MKPILEKVARPENQSFFFRDLEQAHFTTPWHFHPEIEIILIVSGHGSRYVGDSIKNFYPGDLVITGSNTPHVWSSSLEFFEPYSNLKARAIFIQFEENFWGEKYSEHNSSINHREPIEEERYITHSSLKCSKVLHFLIE